MSKKWFGAVAGVMLAVGASAGADAGIEVSRMVTPATQTVEAGASFTVTYSDCVFFEDVVFNFQGQSQTVPCDAQVDEALEAPQGFRRPAGGLGEVGSASATFTAPSTAGTFEGTAEALPTRELRPQSLRRPAQTQCSGDCVPFQVTVAQAPTTVPATTAAPSPTNAPATTSGGVSDGGANNTLPATGSSSSDNAATIAVLLLVAGVGLVVMTRVRAASDPS